MSDRRWPDGAPGFDLPKRVTKRWARGLSNEDLVLAYRSALYDYDHWQDYSDARTVSRRLTVIVDEMARRQGAGKMDVRW